VDEDTKKVYPIARKEISQTKKANTFVIHKPLLESILEDAMYITGWVSYYKIANMKTFLIYWKRWKLVRTKYRNLIKLGINKYRGWK
jgi:hypothetical protein